MAQPHDTVPRGQAPVPARRAGERRADVLQAITRSREGLGIRALSEATGLHDNTVRFHLERLVAEGLVERRQGVSAGPGRPPLTFVARRDHADAGHDNYELIARVLAAQLEDRAGAVEAAEVAEAAGRAWGREHAGGGAAGVDARPSGGGGTWDDSLDELTSVLDAAGFAPEVQVEQASASVRVHHCPFGQLAREDRTVPCAVHMGLMQGVLEAAGGAAEVDRLEPFVTPTLCLAHLSRAKG